jgi:phage-related protein
MSVSVGGISLDMILNSAQFRKQLNSIQTQADSVGNKISGSFKKVGVAIASAFSVAVIKKFGQECIESAASVQAANSQFAQTFGDMQEQANAAMKAVADESQITQSRLQGVGTSIYAFAKTTGMESSQALTMMQDALKVTADSAAYYDRSLEDTAESLKSFLKGNFENDAALGLSCTETTRNTAANKLYGKSFKDLSESQKQLTLLQMVKDANKLSGALGQASRESDGWENVLGNLKETWNQFLAVVGKPVLQGAVVVIKSVTSALSTLTEHARNAISALYELFGWDTGSVSNDLASTANSVGLIASEADSSSSALDSVADSAEKAKGSVAGFDKLNVLGKKGSSSSSSSKSTDTGVNSVVATSANSIKDKFSNLYENSGLKKFIDKVKKAIESLDFTEIIENCKAVLENLKKIVKAVVDAVKKVVVAVIDAIVSKIKFIATIVTKIIQTISGAIRRWLERDNLKIIGFITGISENFRKGFENISEIYEWLTLIIGGSIDRMRLRVETSLANLLSGITSIVGTIATVISEAFAIATGSIVKWLEKDGAEIGLFFDNLQLQIADVMTFIGGVFSDIGTTISNWWNGEGGSTTFSNICDMFTNIGTTLMNVYNEWIKPVWDYFIGIVQSAWTNCLSPVFGKLLNFFSTLGENISHIWNNVLSPFINFIVDFWGPIFTNTFNAIKGVVDTVFTVIGDVVGGFIDTLSGLIDFIVGIFTLDFDRAIIGFVEIVVGAFEMIWGVIKGVINLVIDGINLLWTNVYNVVSGIINGIGGIAGALGDMFGKDWHFEMPENPPLIPKLAKGGIVKAPTLAVVGDNVGASTGDPEVISPLSKLQGMINTSNGQDVVILSQILDYLKRIYEMFIVFRNNGGNYYEFVAKLNGSDIFEEVVRQNDLYKKRHNGKSAFA